MASVGSAPVANIWTAENQVSSDGHIREIPLPRLQNPQQLFGQYAKVFGEFSLHGQFKWEPFLGNGGPRVTQDPFDQGQLYFSLDQLVESLNGLGFDMVSILGAKHGGRSHPIEAHANKVPDLNAWYSPQEDTLTFGRGDEKWHLASDSDVSVHEAGHLVLDHIHPDFGGRFGNEGGAIHEAFGDALAALYYNDPEMSEDFAVALGKPPSKLDGLRLVNNNLKLADVSTEVHDRGQVYAGFFWGLKTKLGMESGAAAQVTLMLLINHAANYRTTRPQPQDFIEAILEGAKAMDATGKLPVPYAEIETLVQDEAKSRGIPLPQPPLVTRVPPKGPFERISQVGFIGGRQEIYQQFYTSKQYGKIPILKRGYVVHRGTDGNIYSVSTRDVRVLKGREINETIRLKESEALARVQSQLQLDAHRVRVRLVKMPLPQSREDFYQLQELQMERKVLDRCAAVLRDSTPKPRIVIEPDGDHLVYEFALGYARGYVDAITGTVTLERDVFF